LWCYASSMSHADDAAAVEEREADADLMDDDLTEEEIEELRRSMEETKEEDLIPAEVFLAQLRSGTFPL